MGDIFIASQDSTNHGSAVNTAGGGYFFEAGHADRYQGTFAQLHSSGGIVDSAGAVVTSDDGGQERYTSAGNFTNALVGMYVYIDGISGSPGVNYRAYIIDTDNSDYVTLSSGFTSITADIAVGGFVADADYLDGEGQLAVGDELWLVGGQTYTLAADWSLAGGSSGVPVKYKTIDSNGAEVLPERATQGLVKTGVLDTSVMAIIDCTASFFIAQGTLNTLQGLRIIGSRNIPLVRSTSADNLIMYLCSMLNTGAGASAACVRADNFSRFVNCDMESESTELTIAIAQCDAYMTLIGCRVKSIADAGECVVSTSAHVSIGNIYIGNGNNVGIQAGITILAAIERNTFYNLSEAVQASSGTIRWAIASNLVVTCTFFFRNATSADLYVVASNNCIADNMAAANRYGGASFDVLGIIGANDTISTETQATIFEDAANGDFRLLGTFTDANQVALLDNTCGAINAADYPDAGNVTEDDTTNGVTGTYHEATTAEVQSGVTFGASQALTGTFTTATPGTPTFTVETGSNAFTATIDGDAGATNFLIYKTTSDSAWVAGGNRSGDGDITVSTLSDDVPYTIVVYSVTASSNSEPGIAQTVTFTSTSDNLYDTAIEATTTPFFNIYKKPVTYLPSGGGSRSINALIAYLQDSDFGPHGSSPFANVTVHNDSTTGIARSELVLGRDKITMPMRDGSEQDRIVRDIVSTDAAWVVLEVT